MKFKLADPSKRAKHYVWAGKGTHSYLMRREPKPFAALPGRQRVKARKRDQRLRRKLFHEAVQRLQEQATK